MGYLNDLYKIFKGTVAGDKTGTPARTAAQGINENMDKINNALEIINTASEKAANKVTTLEAANNTTFPTSLTVKGYVDGKETAANNYTATQLANYQAKAEKNQPNGYMGLDENGIALAANLPVAVDEIIEGAYIDASTFNNTAGDPVIPAKAKIYMDILVNPVKQYRWGGTTFGEINPNVGTSDEIAEGNVNLYFKASRVLATVLDGLETVAALAVNSGDTILAAIGKLQAQFNALASSLANKLEKGSYNGTAQDLKALIDAKETPLNAQSKADQAETNAKNYADSLLKAGVGESYPDLAGLLADQANQDLNGIYEVVDASGDPTVVGGYAYYKYLGTTTANLADYRKLSEEESMDIGGGVTQNYVDTEVATAKNRANHTGTQTANTISDFATAAQVEIDKLGAAILVTASRNFLASDNGKILMITANITLTVPSNGLQNAFRCDLDCTSTGQAAIAKDAGAVVLDFPAGQILEAGKMGTMYRKSVGTYPNEYRGKGEFKI